MKFYSSDMVLIHIYFGDNIFHKLPQVSDNSVLDIAEHESSPDYEISPIHNYFKQCKVFSRILYSSGAPQEVLIDEVFLGWSFNLYQSGEKYFHIGFPKFMGELYEVLNVELCKNLLVTCNMNQVYASTCDGKFFSYSTRDLQLQSYDFSNHKLEVKKLVSGDFCTIILNNDGTVFLLNLLKNTPLTKMHLPSKIVEVACGKEHALFLSFSGQIFSFGNGSRGQLGHGGIINYETPTLIEALDGIEMKAVACGGWHSAAVSYSGDLYLWGWNESGQLSFPCTQQFDDANSSDVEIVCCLPKIVDFEEKQIVSVSCGSRHTAVLTDDNQVWTWGWNEYGQLGHSKYPLTSKPCKISLPSKFVPKYIKCAFWSTLITGTLNI